MRGAQLDPETDAALLRYCEREGLTLSEAIRRLLDLALRAQGTGGLGTRRLAEREALRTAKRELLGAVASATLRR